jgi:hypothetical protein
MSNYFGDEPFTSEEDLFFEKLFGEDELSQRKTSKTTSKTRYVIFIFILIWAFFYQKASKLVSKSLNFNQCQKFEQPDTHMGKIIPKFIS